MPCLKNFISLHRTEAEQKKEFIKLLKDTSETFSENTHNKIEQQKSLTKIEALKRECHKLRILNEIDLPQIQNIFQKNFIYFSKEYISEFFQPYN